MRRFLLLLSLALLAAALVAVAPAAAWTWPTGGPVLLAFSFDPAHPYSAGEHRGIDIGGDPGSAVLAPAGGVVTFAGTVPGNGKSLTILTSDGWSVTLTQLGSIAVAKGASVAEGDAVATIGPSGDAEVAGPYVQLGIRHADQDQGYVDPQTLLPPRSQAPVVPPTTGGTVQPPSAVSVPTSTTPVDGPSATTDPAAVGTCGRRGSATAGGQRGGSGRRPGRGRRSGGGSSARGGDRSTDRGSERRAERDRRPRCARRRAGRSYAARGGGHTRCGACSRRIAGLGPRFLSRRCGAADGCAEPIDGRSAAGLACRSGDAVARRRCPPACGNDGDRCPGSTSPAVSRPLVAVDGALAAISASRSARPAATRVGSPGSHTVAPGVADRHPGVSTAHRHHGAPGVPSLAGRCGARARARVAAHNAPPTGDSPTRSYDCPR